MTWEELENRIDKFYLDEENKVKIPYSHYDFDRPVEPPHLMSTEVDTDNTGILFPVKKRGLRPTNIIGNPIF